MKEILLGDVAAIAVAVVALSGSANAACYANGHNWNCRSSQIYHQPHIYRHAQHPYYGHSHPNSHERYSHWDPARYPGPRANDGDRY